MFKQRSRERQSSFGETQNKRPPDFIGSVVALKPTLKAIMKHFLAGGLQEIVCTVRGWSVGTDQTGCLLLEISRPRKTTVPSKLKGERAKRRPRRHSF
jgi:hypothetical protein